MRFLKLSALMAIMLFSAVLMLALLTMRGFPAAPRGGGVPGATINGDVNCDGKVDIADAIGIIQWQFMGGAAPCALAEDPGVLDKLNALSAQITTLQGSVASLAATWPPKAEDVVSVAQKAGNNASDNVAYVVPEGKTFVLMNVTIASPLVGRIEISEVAGGKKTLKWQEAPGPFVSSIGLRFSSGSQVRCLLFDTTHGCSPKPCDDPISYSFAGYLIDG